MNLKLKRLLDAKVLALHDAIEKYMETCSYDLERKIKKLKKEIETYAEQLADDYLDVELRDKSAETQKEKKDTDQS